VPTRKDGKRARTGACPDRNAGGAMEQRDHNGKSLLSRRALAGMHIAKKALCIEDDDWRDLLFRVCGVRSATLIQPEAVYTLERELRRLGWDGWLTERFVMPKKYDNLGFRAGRPSPKQLRMLEAMFSQLPGIHDKDAALRGFLRKRFGIDNMAFLATEQYEKALAAVRAMKRRGKEPL
jgi:hypothetical protein